MNPAAPVTDYAEPAPHWADWYAEYRYGALYLFPPPPLRSRINALRSRHDPRSQAICDAHVSLTVPLPRPLTVLDADDIAAALRGVAPFDVLWGPPYQYPGVPGVVLRIAPERTLAALVRTLEARRCFAGAAPRHHPFSPHMTIAEFINLRQSADLLAQLHGQDLTGQFRCTEIVYAVPDADFRFTERYRWAL